MDIEQEDEQFLEEREQVTDNKDVANIEEHTNDEIGIVDPCMDMEMGMTRDDEEGRHHAKVKRRAADKDGKPVGRPNDNPLSDHCQHEAEFMDGRTEILIANMTAENLLAQVNDDGHRHLLIDETEDHRVTSDAVSKTDGQKRKKRTTRAWMGILREMERWLSRLGNNEGSEGFSSSAAGRSCSSNRHPG